MADKPVLQKKPSKNERIERILIGLVEYYVKTGKAVGSNTLKEAGFADLSSATIRNYFAELEEKGFLLQQHTSGGRVPTALAFRVYATFCQNELENEKSDVHHATKIGSMYTQDMREIALFLQQATVAVSEETECAAFLSSPRFDQDFVTDIKLVSIDATRVLAILLTSFGQVYTETLGILHKISLHSLKRIEEYLHARLTGHEPGFDELTPEELDLAVRFYQEAIARYIVRYANFTQEDVFRTGFSKLLRYPEFQEAESLTSSLALFENELALRSLVREAMKAQSLKVWVGDDLFTHLTTSSNCSVISVPYRIAHKKVGAIGIIGPLRMPYKQIMAELVASADDISHFLERNLYKHKITFRTPRAEGYEIGESSKKLLLGPKDKQLIQHQGM